MTSIPKNITLGSESNLRKETSLNTISDLNKLKKRTNIRHLYIKSLHQNRSVKGGIIRSKNITNLDSSSLSKGSSSYLTNEYNLVKKILNATKALEKLKSKNGNEFITRSSAPKYKTQEEYYEENLELKKSLKLFENNEMITKAKMEYYESELAKKEQEIINLLDLKKDELRTSDSKSDLETTSLRLKAYKLEFSLKRKDVELKKLKEDFKTTSIKELKLQNERLRDELSKALMNEKKIIEAQEIKGISIVNGKPIYEFLTAQNAIQSSEKNEKLKQNIAKRLQKSENYFDDNDDLENEFVSNTNMKEKIILKGSLKEKLMQLDNRETELLLEVNRLNNIIQDLNENHSARKSHRSQSGDHGSSSSQTSEKSQLNVLKTLQSVMKGHLVRSRSLKSLNNEKEQEKIKNEKILIDKPNFKKLDKNISPRSPSLSRLTPPFSPEIIKNERKYNHRVENFQIEYNQEKNKFKNTRRNSNETTYRESNKQFSSQRRNIRSKEVSLSSEDESRELLEKENENKILIEEKKIVEETCGGCCSPNPFRKTKDTKAISKKFF